MIAMITQLIAFHSCPLQDYLRDIPKLNATLDPRPQSAPSGEEY